MKNHKTANALLLCVAMVAVSHAQVFTTLVNLNKAHAYPQMETLVQGFDGNLYGTSEEGGRAGTIFGVTPLGAIRDLYRFSGTDGSSPLSGLTLGRNGNLFGTTSGGGTAKYYGVAFEITTTGAYTILYSFDDGANGGYTFWPPIQGRDGNFYGTTTGGGTYGGGTIFKINSSGVLTTLHSFANPEGVSPGPLLLSTDGNLYGTTKAEGANFLGTFFKMTPSGVFTTLYNFCSLPNCADGGGGSPLLQASDGNFYGVSIAGGAFAQGLIYQLTSSGVLTTFHSFCALPGCTDGFYPVAGLMQATDGNLYSTTYQGGVGPGVIYSITLGGAFNVVHSFMAGEGGDPNGGLLQATDGKFYGTTLQGGTGNYGTVFSLDMGLGPFVRPLPGFGRTGAKVTILGTNLTGTTNVSFNGTAASFTLVSGTEIKTTVPAGATTGNVTVTTPSGALVSNTVFQVLH